MTFVTHSVRAFALLLAAVLPLAAPARLRAASTRTPASGAQTRLFAPNSIWNRRLGRNARVDRNSGRMVIALASEAQREQQAKRGPWINTRQYGVPIVTVPANQRMVRVNLPRDAPPVLRTAFGRVPLPRSATPSEGTDRYLALWQPSSNRMWEFWQLRHDKRHRWLASWGGAMNHVTSNIGVYGPRAWPGATSAWGVTATAFPLIGGVITIGELESGHINHALAIALPNVRAGVFASPAERTDGSDQSTTAIPEGARLRIDPSLNLNRISMPPLTRMIALAAQRYGMIVRDYSGNIAFSAEDPGPSEPNPYAGASGLYGGLYPNELLQNFPWNHIEVLRMNLHSGSSPYPGS